MRRKFPRSGDRERVEILDRPPAALTVGTHSLASWDRKSKRLKKGILTVGRDRWGTGVELARTPSRFTSKNKSPERVILRLGEESSSATACERPAGFFAPLPMNSLVCQVERSETSRVVSACDADAGFFAQPQNDRRGIVHNHNHAAGQPVGWRAQNDKRRLVSEIPYFNGSGPLGGASAGWRWKPPRRRRVSPP